MGIAVLESFEFRSGAVVRRGLVDEPVPVLSTGIAALDRILPGGGLPQGQLTELTGRRAAGKLSLALAVAARILGRGEPVVLVDPSATILPDVWTAPALARLLAVRGSSDPRRALNAADALLATGAFALLVIDLPGRAFASLPVFLRLGRQARPAGTAVVLVSEWLPWRPNGISEQVGLRLNVQRTRRGLEVTVGKSRTGGEGARALIDLAVPGIAAGDP